MIVTLKEVQEISRNYMRLSENLRMFRGGNFDLQGKIDMVMRPEIEAYDKLYADVERKRNFFQSVVTNWNDLSGGGEQLDLTFKPWPFQ